MNDATRPAEALPAYTSGHPAFAGHFPGLPIVPGVLLLDAALHQIGATLGLSTAGCRIAAAKFTSAIGPNEALLLSHAATAEGGLRLSVHAGAEERLAATAVVHYPTESSTP